jgi:hypothetical protein
MFQPRKNTRNAKSFSASTGEKAAMPDQESGERVRAMFEVLK